MESPIHPIESLMDELETYGKTTIELNKLKAMAAGSVLLALLVKRISVVALMLLFFLFLNIGLALFWGQWLNSMSYGFFMVAAIYLVLGVPFHFFLHGWIQKPITDYLFSLSKQ